MIILGHCCISGRSHHVCPLIYTLSTPTVIISYIMANSFLINPCNALSDSHGISDGQSDIRGIGRLQMRPKLSAQEAMRG